MQSAEVWGERALMRGLGLPDRNMSNDNEQASAEPSTKRGSSVRASHGKLGLI